MSVAMLLAACNNAPKPAEPEKPVEDQQPTVDWDMPLYELSAEGDTTCVWTYLESEEGRTVIQLSEQEDSFYDRYEYQYGPDGKLVRMKVENGPWKVRVREVTYGIDLDLKTREGEGKEYAEGDPQYYEVREQSWCLDDNYLYDTVTYYYSAVVSWDELDKDGDGVQDYWPTPVWEDYTVQRTRYVETPLGWKPAEKKYFAGFDEEWNPLLNARVESTYDEEGRLTSETTYYMGGSTETKNYTYEGNVRTMQATPYSAEIKTYYKINP